MKDTSEISPSPINLFAKTGIRGASALMTVAALLFACAPVEAQSPAPEEGFVSLFDGTTLNGWKIGDNAELFSAHDGMIVMDCPATNHHPAHLFYEGDVNGHKFKNFDLRVDVLTSPGANSGIYFHTKFQQAGFPRNGIECQVDNSHSDWRRTGSLYGIRNLTWGPEKPNAAQSKDVIFFDPPPVNDNVWYTQEIICQNSNITVKLNGKTVLEYTDPESAVEHKQRGGMTWLPEGTFALQGHPPMPGHISKACFKNIRVKVLPD